MRIQEEKIELQKEVHRRICFSDIVFLIARPPSYVIFCRFSRVLCPFRLLRFYVEKKSSPETTKRTYFRSFFFKSLFYISMI